jgi:hypothetical protein
MVTLLFAVALQQPALPQKQLVPDLRIAAADAGEDFTLASSVAEAGGRIFISDLRVPTIFRFDARGKPEGKVGRAGQGPGEYRFPAILGAVGDTLWVGDAQQQRILLYPADGKPGRTVALTGGRSGVLAYSADGTSLAIPMWGSNRAFPDQPPKLPLLRFGLDGTRADTLLQVAVQLGQLQLDLPGGNFLIGPQPFDDSPLVAASSAGDGFVLVERRTTGPAVITVTRFGSDGVVRWQRRIDYPSGPLDPVVIDSVVRDKMKPASPELPAIPEATVRKALVIPPRLIAVFSAHLAPDGTLWLRRPGPVGSAPRYTVLDREGRPAFEVATPPGKLLGFGTGTVWFGAKDEDDLPIVTRYRIQ